MIKQITVVLACAALAGAAGCSKSEGSVADGFKFVSNDGPGGGREPAGGRDVKGGGNGGGGGGGQNGGGAAGDKGGKGGPEHEGGAYDHGRDAARGNNNAGAPTAADRDRGSNPNAPKP